MGVLTDIIVGDPGEVSDILASEGGHLKAWDCLESKGIDTVKLGTLSQILAGRPIDDVDAVVDVMQGRLVSQKSVHGPWVFWIPNELVEGLANLEGPNMAAVAAKWADTEEGKLDRWDADGALHYLHDLANHAKKARQLGKGLLLWMCL